MHSNTPRQGATLVLVLILLRMLVEATAVLGSALAVLTLALMVSK